MGIIATAIIGSLSNTLFSSSSSNNSNVALNNLRYSSEWLTNDIKGTDSITPISADLTSGSGSITLKWLDINNVTHTITYTISNNDELQRTFDGGLSVVASSVTHINSSYSNGKVNLLITASTGSGSEQKTFTKSYEIVLRPA